jgi:hypothetical protein
MVRLGDTMQSVSLAHTDSLPARVIRVSSQVSEALWHRDVEPDCLCGALRWGAHNFPAVRLRDHVAKGRAAV